MRKMRYISVTSSVKKEIASELSCTIQAVYKALNYKSDGALAEQARALAFQKGGFHAFKNV